jgi:RNA recognition motif-containing protein
VSNKKIYVGNISFKANEDDLKRLFSQAGEIVSVRLIKDATTGRFRGFGFIEMSSTDEVNKAISMFNGKSFMERNLVVSEAKPRDKKVPWRTQRERSYASGRTGDLDN